LAARLLAIIDPIPDPPPVTTATKPSISNKVLVSNAEDMFLDPKSVKDKMDNKKFILEEQRDICIYTSVGFRTSSESDITLIVPPLKIPYLKFLFRTGEHEIRRGSLSGKTGREMNKKQDPFNTAQLQIIS
jgi:hypothetical protein